MAVTNRNGRKLDLVAIKSQLIKDKEAGKVSAKDYRKALKGLDKVSDAGKNGINYQFTGQGVFKTSSGNGQSPTLNQAGVGVNTRIPLFGKKVSKGLGYAQQLVLAEDEKAKQAGKNASPSGEKTSAANKKDSKADPKKSTESKLNLDPLSIPEITPADIAKAQKGKINAGFDNPEISKKDMALHANPNKVKPVGSAKGKTEIASGFTPHWNPAVSGVDATPRHDKKAFLDRINKAIGGTGVGPAKGVKVDKAKKKEPSFFQGAIDVVSNYEKMRSKKPASSASKKFAKGGKIKLFAGGGNGVNDTNDPQKKINADITSALKKAAPKIFASKLPKASPLAVRGFQLKSQPLKTAKVKGVQTSLVGDKRTVETSPNIEGAVNENAPGIDKDSLINTAMGVYGAASLIGAKKPKLRRPETLNLNIRPAQGDEDMVSRSNNAIDESVRQGVGMLRKRTGSDLTSYVQGATAMVDGAGKSRADVLGHNAQLKRQDEVRMSGEVNQGKQTNFAVKDQHRQLENSLDQQTYAQRVQGAQASVNNSLNYGVQKRADERNLKVQKNMVDKRYNTQMLAYAKMLREQGYTPEQIATYLKSVKDVSYKKGGKLDISDRIIVNANSVLGKANKELRKVLSEYSKLISNASQENIKQFNQNIRAISKRSNITITTR